MEYRLLPGKPGPLGSYFDNKGTNFSLYSAHAEGVELCLFKGDREIRLPMTQKTGDIWHGYLPGSCKDWLYGYRVYGPWQPDKGLFFNPNKLLIDPYCRCLEGELLYSKLSFENTTEPDQQDNASVMMKCRVLNETYDWQQDVSPTIDWANMIIYEAHVRGITSLHPDIPKPLSGTYAGLAHPVMIDYLTKLGITSLELMPVQHHIDEPRLQKLGLHNYWGYNVIAPFAVEPRYWSGQKGSTPLSEFRDMVKALHKANIEIIIDVVFNHTAELDKYGPTLSLRGIDNLTYYWINSDGDYQNWTGCGNTLKLTQPAVLRWVMDCLRYWVTECHVDGFRFDLAAVLGRTPNFNADSPLLSAIAQDPLLSKVKLICEPWDIGPNGYQLGQFHWPFAQWNDRFRDDIRTFWLHKQTTLGSLARRFAASDDMFNRRNQPPSASINMITAHDGFTLKDLVSFNEKHNEANGENNRDGHNENFSNNHGKEGMAVSCEIEHTRLLSTRALLALLLLAQGTPMLLAGDEWGNSQQGNNNAYCQDNEITWLAWKDANIALIEYTKALITLRKQIPVLNSNQWWTGQYSNETHYYDVRWLNKHGKALSASEWQTTEGTLLIELSGCWLIIINATSERCVVIPPQGNWQISAPFTEKEICFELSDWYAEPYTISVLRLARSEEMDYGVK